jgi:hypothetical protein
MSTVNTPNDPVPEILFCQARAGDGQALGHLITLYRPSIFRRVQALASWAPSTSESDDSPPLPKERGPSPHSYGGDEQQDQDDEAACVWVPGYGVLQAEDPGDP